MNVSIYVRVVGVREQSARARGEESREGGKGASMLERECAPNKRVATSARVWMGLCQFLSIMDAANGGRFKCLHFIYSYVYIYKLSRT